MWQQEGVEGRTRVMVKGRGQQVGQPGGRTRVQGRRGEEGGAGGGSRGGRGGSCGQGMWAQPPLHTTVQNPNS